MKYAWITGARGFIGRHLVNALRTRGVRVAGLGHGLWVEPAARSAGLSYWLNGDVTEANLRRLEAATERPDTVFHLAGGSSVGASLLTPEEDFRRTVDSTQHLLEWLRERAEATRLIFASSAAVYGDGTPLREDSPCRPRSPYGYHKLIAELLIESYSQTYGLSTIVLRPFSVYGPFLQKQLLWDLCCRIREGHQEIRLGGDGTETRDFIEVSDVVQAMIKARELAAHLCPRLNVGSGIPTTVRDIAAHVLRETQCAASLVFTGVKRAGDPRCLVADTTLAQSMGLHPTVDLASGLAAYVDWFRSEGN